MCARLDAVLGGIALERLEDVLDGARDDPGGIRDTWHKRARVLRCHSGRPNGKGIEVTGEESGCTVLAVAVSLHRVGLPCPRLTVCEDCAVEALEYLKRYPETRFTQ